MGRVVGSAVVVLRRNRQFDLLQVLAIEPLLMGLGIDEGTALLVTEERADVIGQSYVAVYNSAEWWAASDSSTDSSDSGVPQRDPFYVLGHGQSLDLVTRLPVGGEGAGDIEDELMRAILSDPELVVIMRQSSAQQLLLHLQMVSSLHAKTVQSAAAHYSVRVLLLHSTSQDPRRAIEAYKSQPAAVAFIQRLYGAIERLRAGEADSSSPRL